MAALVTSQVASQVANQLTESASNSDLGNGTAAIIADLVFAESKSVRTSTVILSAFNILAALATALSILWDCYWASKQCSPGSKAERKFCVSHIHPAETFPLVVSLGIVIQGIVFAASQGTGLQSSSISGCSTIAQFMFPALFLVPYIQIVFGLECAIRSFRSLPFQARGKYDVTICIATVFLMTLATWLPTHIHPQKNYCFASLVWFVTNFSLVALFILASITGFAFISAVTIFCRLSSFTSIDRNQRIAASRMVYYLVLAIVPIGFVLPFFITQVMGKDSYKTGMMATVVLNLSGLMTGLLQLFLRSNTTTTSFKPKDTPGWNGDKHEVKLWGPNELGFRGHMLQPVSLYKQSVHSDVTLATIEKERAMSLESLTSLPLSKSPVASKSPSLSTTATSPVRGPNINYSLFPSEDITSPSKAQLPIPSSIFKTPTITTEQDPFSDPSHAQSERESVYSIGSLLPPKPLFSGNRHGRNSSMISTATVQIGLRLSHAPFAFGNNGPDSPLSRPVSPALPRLQTSGLANELSRSDSRNKRLPPVPKIGEETLKKFQAEKGVQLSSSVYSPSNSSSTSSTKSVKEDMKETLGGDVLSPKVYSPDSVGRSESLRRNESYRRKNPPLEQSIEQKEGEWI